MTEQWQELKETITELRDNDGTATQQEVCKFLANLMDVLEKQMQEQRTGQNILDKIRAEIVEVQKEYQEHGWVYDDALEIIDRYKAKSEGKE